MGNAELLQISLMPDPIAAQNRDDTFFV